MAVMKCFQAVCGRYCLLLVLLMLSASRVYAGGQDLVLVMGQEAPVINLTNDEVRRLYLGVPVLSAEGTLRPLRNHTDATIYEAFLQKILFLSEAAYHRRLLSDIVRAKGFLPTEYENQAALVAALEADPLAVSYMWSGQAEHYASLKVVRVLWQP